MKFILENPETTLIGKLKNILLGWFVIFLWMQVALPLIAFFTQTPRTPYPIRDVLWYLFFGCIMAPLSEEALYRYVPLTIAKLLGKSFILPAMVGSSLLFGFYHGYGYISILLQGVTGFVLACVYIKNGFSLWSSMLLHCLWNVTCWIHPM